MNRRCRRTQAGTTRTEAEQEGREEGRREPKRREGRERLAKVRKRSSYLPQKHKNFVFLIIV